MCDYDVDKSTISENIGQLVDAIDLNALRPHLINNGVFTKATLAAETGSGSAVSQKQGLLFGLKKKNSQALSKFVKSLSDAQQFTAAKLMCPDFVEPPPGESRINEVPSFQLQGQSQYQQPHFQIPRTGLTTTPNIAPFPSSDEQNEDDPLYIGQEVIAHTLPDIIEVKVRRAVQRYPGARPSDCYRMESPRRGYALIFVNEFNGRPDMYRKGASKDRTLLESLFSQLGYEVIVHENTTRYGMQSKLQHFTSDPELASVDSCVVVVSSHGEEDAIVCDDLQHMPIKCIKEMFDNENCPHLSGKPKLFIIQACRGGNIDGGVVEETDGPNIPYYSMNLKSKYKPTVTDMLIAYSTSPGYVANRTIIGSWYVYLLTDVFMKRAWNTRLADMLMEVNRRMSQLKTQEGDKQAAETVWQGWHKKLFFNPGL